MTNIAVLYGICFLHQKQNLYLYVKVFLQFSIQTQLNSRLQKHLLKRLILYWIRPVNGCICSSIDYPVWSEFINYFFTVIKFQIKFILSRPKISTEFSLNQEWTFPPFPLHQLSKLASK